ncbi:hypothetical protein B0O99DRAFT_636606 [Bisporella sp. PMI_857]|nr:hypothetical protein B0O99DRAFT_636606 [Bisporella sp. PMI_857]
MEGIVLSQLHGSQSYVNLRMQRERFMKINVFKNRHRSSWQRSVRSAANDNTPFIWDDAAGLHANENFPLNHLQHCTNDYLGKKKRLGKDEVERRLVEYVQLSAENDRADIAIAACGHKLSRASLRRLLTGDLFVTQPGNVINILPFLIAIVTANRVNPDAIDNLEAEKAKAIYAAAMMPHGLEGYWGRYVHELMKILIDGLPMHLLVYPYIMTRIRQTCTSLALHLQQLRDEGQFLRAYSSSQ